MTDASPQNNSDYYRRIITNEYSTAYMLRETWMNWVNDLMDLLVFNLETEFVESTGDGLACLLERP